MQIAFNCFVLGYAYTSGLGEARVRCAPARDVGSWHLRRRSYNGFSGQVECSLTMRSSGLCGTKFPAKIVHCGPHSRLA